MESELTDFLELGQLQFDSNGNTSITIDSDFELTGDNAEGGPLRLVSSSTITDAETSDILAEGTVSITALDLMIEELANDSFDVLNGDESLFVNFSGLIEIVLNQS